MEAKIVVGVVTVTAFGFGLGTAGPAAAAGNNQVVGIEQEAGEANGTTIAYTVSKILPSVDAVAHPVAGQLYEATVMARALQGTVVPLVPSFSAHAASGASYPALADVSSLSTAPLADDATTEGKIYFDVVGPVPNSVVYDDPPGNVLTWSEPVAGDPTGGSTGGGSTGGGSTGGGSTGGGDGARGVTGSTGPNQASPSTSGGDIGGGAGGTEGGGGNLSSGGGSGAPSGSTGGSSGLGNGGGGGAG